jgi:hypothetical protein
VGAGSALYQTAVLKAGIEDAVPTDDIKDTNTSSHPTPADQDMMQPFEIMLANGATLTGLHNLPDPSITTLKYCPLVVGLHGGSYSSLYFDVDANHTAAIQSNALGVPFVAINRPGYEGSTTFYPLPEGSSFEKESGVWFHRYILPALWTEFGLPRGCSSIVLHCHSLGAPGAIIAAARTSQEEEASEKLQYPLSGMIISGWGTKLVEHDLGDRNPGPPPTHANMPLPVKDIMMMPQGTCDPEMYKHTERLDRPLPYEELGTLRSRWLPQWKTEFGQYVKIPVMIGVAEKDALWEGTEEHVKDFASAFTASERVDASLIRRAPHNIEMSYWAQGWYARSFGFAVECAASFSVKG